MRKIKTQEQWHRLLLDKTAFDFSTSTVCYIQFRDFVQMDEL